MSHQYQKNILKQQQSETQNELDLLEKKRQKIPTEVSLNIELNNLTTQPTSPVPTTIEASFIRLSYQAGMILNQINLVNQQDQTKWHLELTGSYHQFIAFLRKFSKLTWTVGIHRIEIRANRERLIFLLTLLSS